MFTIEYCMLLLHQIFYDFASVRYQMRGYHIVRLSYFDVSFLISQAAWVPHPSLDWNHLTSS